MRHVNDKWVDITTPEDGKYEVQYNPYLNSYRHRITVDGRAQPWRRGTPKGEMQDGA